MIKPCRRCKKDFEPTAAQEKHYKWTCPSCKSGNGQVVVSLYVRACRRCNNNFFPSPSQIRMSQWICNRCRWWERKSRAKTLKGRDRFRVKHGVRT